MYKQSIEQGNEEAHGQIGEVYLLQGRYRVAAEHFEKYVSNGGLLAAKIEMKLFYCYSTSS